MKSKQVIIVTEKYVDGLISKNELTSNYTAADAAYTAADAAYTAWSAYTAYTAWAAANAAANKEQVLAKQHQLFDDIFGS